jgi:hypothetical protein
MTLATLRRADELIAIWVANSAQEASYDLTRHVSIRNTLQIIFQQYKAHDLYFLLIKPQFPPRTFNLAKAYP